ncbi:MAG: hypothetical protein OEU26_25385 [Candidatus Tectomicrobia bacterium]|nr:hypothetical protein [Candidatus Tectomicrobia bacterium]
MAIHTAPQVTALQALAAVNLFLSDHLPDRFTADQPQLIAADNVWQIPIILVYPRIGSLGCVGHIQISTTEEKIISHTPLADMKQAAQQLYSTHHDAIEAAFS